MPNAVALQQLVSTGTLEVIERMSYPETFARITPAIVTPDSPMMWMGVLKLFVGCSSG